MIKSRARKEIEPRLTRMNFTIRIRIVELRVISVDDKTGENYLGLVSQQPRSIAFEKDATNMLTDKE